MGMILIGALLVGCVLGVVIAAILGSAGLVVASKRAKTRAHVWRNFAVAFGVVLVLCVVVVYHFPYDIVRPGSDYDVAVKNLFLQGLAYCASPGVSALLGPADRTGGRPRCAGRVRATAKLVDLPPVSAECRARRTSKAPGDRP